MKIVCKKLILMWILLSINLLFAFIIGLTIPMLESENKCTLGFIIIPLMLIFNYIVLNRFYHLIVAFERKNSNEEREL